MLPIYLVVSCFFVTFAESKLQRALTNNETIRITEETERCGMHLSQHGSKHDKWINPKTGAYDYVPRHCKEVAKGTAIKVLIDWQGLFPCQSMSHE